MITKAHIAYLNAVRVRLSPEQWRDIYLGDIAEIRDAVSLRVWSARWAELLREHPHRDQIRQAYLARLVELEKDTIL